MGGKFHFLGNHVRPTDGQTGISLAIINQSSIPSSRSSRSSHLFLVVRLLPPGHLFINCRAADDAQQSYPKIILRGLWTQHIHILGSHPAAGDENLRPRRRRRPPSATPPPPPRLRTPRRTDHPKAKRLNSG